MPLTWKCDAYQMLVLRLVHWAVACLAYISCTGVLVPCVKALQFVTALKAEVLLAEVPVCLCLSHGAESAEALSVCWMSFCLQGIAVLVCFKA